MAVIRRGRHSRQRLARLAARGNELPHNRYGFAVGKRVGGAVVRNRTKRRLREIMHTLPLTPGHDMLVTAEPACAYASFSELSRAIEECARRSGLLRTAQSSQ